jgi:redox-sensitive bicupin YhaK (pirin superfamily)
MKHVVHRATDRGFAHHGWLQSYHSFSFASFYDKERMHFGSLRVLNDDRVSGGMGFGAHPHDNMEIISIPLSGTLEHRDSTGRHEKIQTGDVQIMSAGTGVKHSEFNASPTDDVCFLQIWIYPKVENVSPRYAQAAFDARARQQKWQTLVAPEDTHIGLPINQDAYISLGDFSKDHDVNYRSQQSGNGMYLFVLNGEVQVNDITLKERDAIGIWDTNQIHALVKQDASLLLIEVPM